MQIDILPRTALAFFVLLILTRLLGKKQLSHLTFFNYITGITFGNIAAELASDKDITTMEGGGNCQDSCRINPKFHYHKLY